MIKNWFTCQHPTVVYNKYTRQYVQVNCGQCDYCKLTRNSRWVVPLMIERSCWKYCFFFTLTYNDTFLPTVDINNYPVRKNERNKFLDLVQESKEYLELCKYNLPVCSSRDIQLFIKKLRERIFRATGKRSTFRYFISSDYGSTTFRPHWHGLIFTNDDYISSNISSLLRESWGLYHKSTSTFHPYGFIDCQPAISGAQYVATYVNTVSKLPAIYQFSQFRVRHLHSSCPTIGYHEKTRETPRQIIEQRLKQITVFDPLTNQWKIRDLYQRDLRRYFPALPSMRGIEHVERMEIYRTLLNTLDLLPFSRRKYLRHICKVNTFFNDFVTLNFKLSLKQLNDKLDRLYYAFKRLHTTALMYNYSLNDFDLLVEQYYQSRYFDSLKKQFDYENAFLILHPDKVSDLNSIIDLALPGGNKRKVVSYTYTPDVPLQYDQQYFADTSTKFKKTIKSKVKNNYLEQHPEYKQFH